MPHARINGIDLHYEVGGHGPAILFSHGYSATGEMWNGQRVAFEHTHRVITWDMRGHGSTESPDDPQQYSAALTVGDMVGLLDRLGEPSAVIAGLSLGGYMSLNFALHHPQRTRALVICDSGPGYRNAEAREKWNESAYNRAIDFETKGLEVLGGRSREMREAMSRHQSAQGLAHAARGMLAQFDSFVIDGLPSIDDPTLIICGENDTPFVLPSEYMAKKIPNARLAMIPDAGHAANLDQPEKFNEVLMEFLDALV